MNNKKKIIISFIAILTGIIIILIILFIPKIKINNTQNNLNNNAINKNTDNTNYIPNSLQSNTSTINISSDNANSADVYQSNNINTTSSNDSVNSSSDNTEQMSTEAQDDSTSDNPDRTETSQRALAAAINSEPITDPGYMNRDQMKSVATNFINAYYMTDDWIARKQQLGNCIDQDYISKNKNGLLYQDYFVYDAGENDLIHSYTKLKSIDDITIINAKETSPIVEIKYTFTDKQKGDSGSTKSKKSQTYSVTRTVSYKLTLSKSYKVQEFKFIRNYYN